MLHLYFALDLDELYNSIKSVRQGFVVRSNS
jgi:hypothetical protein